MTIDLQVLADNRDELLLAEVAAWLHNMGKLDPNFLVMQTNDSPDILGLYRIPPAHSSTGAYSFKRFAKPSVLKSIKSTFPYEDSTGVLYFPDENLREGIQQKGIEIEEIKQKLKSSDDKSFLGKQGKQLDKLKYNIGQSRGERDDNEKNLWQQYEADIEKVVVARNWPLGSLLTMFWEKEWFKKPSVQPYQPGSEEDPDYLRQPNPDILKEGWTMDLPALLLLAHGEVSGQEKKGLNQKGEYVDVADYLETSRRLQNLRLSTAFGYEKELGWKAWQQQRKDIIDWVLQNKSDPVSLYKKIQESFQPLTTALGDTQRPINEISLWNYSASTASLFKTALTQYFLTGEMPTPATMKWRLVAVRLNAFEFLFKSSQLADLLARLRTLKEFQRLVRFALEVETPIGSEVYADEHGAVFVIPAIAEETPKEQIEGTVMSLIQNALKNPKLLLKSEVELYGQGDLRPVIRVSEPRRGKMLNVQNILLQEEPTSTPSLDEMDQWWHRVGGICPVCGLRPVAYTEKGLPDFVTKEITQERKICGVCLARRGSRARDWATQRQNESIWNDEVADVNGRLALITGSFDLSLWLNGNLVRSLAIGKDAQEEWLVKPPTFARLRRIWDTTRRFWSEVQEEMLLKHKDDRRRLKIILNNASKLRPYHAYEMPLGKTMLTLVWIPERNGKPGYLVSADNLDYISRQLGAESGICNSPATAAIFVEDFIRKRFMDGQQTMPLKLFNTDDPPDRRQNLLQGARIIDTSHEDAAYATAIPILAEPRTFMMLVPADKALEVIKAIKTKYETEMGKVRNRLPLSLGAVFFGRRTPLFAALDAARHMFDRPSTPQPWQVHSKTDLAPTDDGWPRRVALTLERDGCSITLETPTVMGDDKTKDLWYPYWRVKGKPADREHWFIGPDGKHWVHVKDLREGDTVHLTPSTFDFEYLDVTSRRFEIYYNEDGSRPTHPTRPYYLEDLERLDELWEAFSQLSRTQLKQILQTIETTRQRWFGRENKKSLDDGTFQKFVRNTLANAQWPKAHPWKKLPNCDRLVEAALRGELTDLAELHLSILKEKKE